MRLLTGFCLWVSLGYAFASAIRFEDTEATKVLIIVSVTVVVLYTVFGDWKND